MPELPEVEVLVRRLGPLLEGKFIRKVRVFRTRVVAPTTLEQLGKRLRNARFVEVTRRGKYLVFELQAPVTRESFRVVGHLGMTGRMFVSPNDTPLPKHAAVVLELGRERFVFEDTRYFGRFTLDTTPLERLGPEPLSRDFEETRFALALSRSDQAIKVKLLDQALIAGVGNIYANEALFCAGISPRTPARRLRPEQIRKLIKCVRTVLRHAIQFGSTVPLRFTSGAADGLFYFGRDPKAPDYYSERLRVYDRSGNPCPRCGTTIQRIVQAARSTFFCPKCQSLRLGRKN